MIIMISACLLGLKTRYDNKSKINKLILKKYKNDILIPFCPEQFGTLTIPRLPATLLKNSKYILKNKKGIINKNNEDITDKFLLGAELSLNLVKQIKPDLIIFKENSPSCGLKCTNINWERKKGMGLTAYLSNKKTNIKLISY